MEIFSRVEAQPPAAGQGSQWMALGPVVVVLDEGPAAFVADAGALDGHGGRARNAARVWQVGRTGLGLGLAFRVRILLPAREPSFHSSCLESLQMQRES